MDEPVARVTHETTTNGDMQALAIANLQQAVATLAWLHAEQDQKIARMALAISAIMAQMAQPQVQQTILNQLLGGQQ